MTIYIQKNNLELSLTRQRAITCQLSTIKTPHDTMKDKTKQHEGRLATLCLHRPPTTFSPLQIH